jgi:hypothetical protein
MTKEKRSTLTTPQVAQLIGVAEGTVRSWLSRKTCFIEGQHYIKEPSGRTLWLEEGLEFLKNQSSSFVEETTVTPTVADEILEPLWDTTTASLAEIFLEQLPGRTVARLRKMLATPTEHEREILQKATNLAVEAGVQYLLPGSGGF